MATDVERLMVRLEASAARFEKEMDRARGITNRTAKSIEGRLGGMTRSINVGLGKIGIGLSAAALLNFANNAIKSFGDIADAADRLNLTTDVYQSLGRELKLVGADIEVLEVGIRKFDDAAATAASGKGNALTKLFKDNGIALRDQEGRLRSSTDLLADYARLVANAATPQEKIALATEAFGKSGYKLIAVLEKIAREGLPAVVDEAKRAGLVVEENLLRAADNIGDRWDEMITGILNGLKSMVITAIDHLDQIRQHRINFDTTQGERENQTRELERQFRKSGEHIKAMQLRNFGATDAQLKAAFGNRAAIYKPAPNAPQPLTRPNFETPATKTGALGAGSGSSSRQRLDSFAKEDLQIKKRIADLRAETETINQSAYAQDRARISAELLESIKKRNVEAGKKNAEATAAERAQVEQLANEYAVVAQALREAQQAHDDLNSLMEYTGDTAVDLISNFTTLRDAASNLARSLGTELVRAAITGQGALAGILGLSPAAGSGSSVGGLIGSLFGAFGGGAGAPMNILPRASGGPFPANTPLLVGERGPELLFQKTGGFVVPNTALNKIGSSAAPVSFQVAIDARGATSDAAPSIMAGLRKEVQRMIVPAVRDAQKHGKLRFG